MSGIRRQQILEKVKRNVVLKPPPTDIHGDCWIWQGPHSGAGRGGDYPRMSLNGSTVAVHRAMWTNENGYIPPRKHIDHLCRRRMCVNPDHLEMVTHKENMRRRDRERK